MQVATGRKWAIACHADLSETELFDSDDKSITVSEFDQQTQLSAGKLVALAMDKAHVPAITGSRAQYDQAVEYIERNLTSVVAAGTRDQRLEQALWFTKKAEDMVKYCAGVQYRWPEFERFVVQMCKSADARESAIGRGLCEQYVKQVVHGRWDKFEAMLIEQFVNSNTTSTMAEISVSVTRYINELIGTSWPEFEQACVQVLNTLSTDNAVLVITTMFKYMLKIGSSWDVGITAVFNYIDNTDTMISMFEPCRTYLADSKMGRWPELETRMFDFVRAHNDDDGDIREIMVALVWYCENVIEGRWPKLENAIVDIPRAARTYASRVIRGRWSEAEKHMGFADLVIYLNGFNYKFIAVEDRLVKMKPDSESVARAAKELANYVEKFVKRDEIDKFAPLMSTNATLIACWSSVARKRFPKGEQWLLANKDGSQILKYLTSIVRIRWPEFERMIAQSTDFDPAMANCALAYARSALNGTWKTVGRPELDSQLSVATKKRVPRKYE